MSDAGEVYSFRDTFADHPVPLWERLLIEQEGVRPAPFKHDQGASGVLVDVWHGFHSSDLMPRSDDTVRVEVAGGFAFAVRPEFLLVSNSLSVHSHQRSYDYDSRALLQAVAFEEGYFRDVLARSTLAPYLPALGDASELLNRATFEFVAEGLLARLEPAQRALFSTVEARSLLPLARIDAHKASGLTPTLLLSWADQSPIDFVSRGEQAFGLFLIAQRSQDIRDQEVIEAQELIYEAVCHADGHFESRRFFYAGRDVGP